MSFFDTLETRSADERAADQLSQLNYQLDRDGLPALKSLDELVALPVFRKSDLVDKQKANPPFGGLPV
ncbi:MAG: phenylacetate--CoA ligase family protein, partial [Pseudomonadota bacterium]